MPIPGKGWDCGRDECPYTVAIIPQFYLTVLVYLCVPLVHVLFTVTAGFLNWVVGHLHKRDREFKFVGLSYNCLVSNSLLFCCPAVGVTC